MEDLYFLEYRSESECVASTYMTLGSRKKEGGGGGKTSKQSLKWKVLFVE